MKNTVFIDPAARYYNIEKKWIVSAIPEGPHSILDLGCGTGKLGRKLLELGKADEVVGVEIYEPAAEEAAKYYSRVYREDLESLSLECQKAFDFVVCGDILEHLRNPRVILDRIGAWLRDGGILICSIPNIRYWYILWNLLFVGRWDYTEAGILDNTHLRFFTRRTFLEMLNDADFHVLTQEMWISGRKKNLANRLTLGVFKEFLGSQIIVTARRNCACQ